MRRQRGFTLLELVVVIIIIAVLASLGFTQYTKIMEKSRSAEAKLILGQLRRAQIAYYLENGVYSYVSGLPVDVPTIGPNCINANYFFYYACDVLYNGICVAYRCTAGGKSPQGPSNYQINLTTDGTWGGSAGYY